MASTMTTSSPPGYSRLFATGLFLSTDGPALPGSCSRSATPTPISTTPHTPALETAPRHAYTGSDTLVIPNYNSSHAPRRPKLAALRTHSARATGSSGSNGPLSAGTPTSASVPPSPRVPRRRRSSLTMSHNPIAAIKSPTRAAVMSGRAQNILQSLEGPGLERRTWSLDAVGEQSFETIKASDVENTPTGSSKSGTTKRRAVGARKPPPTAPLPTPPAMPNSTLPTLTLSTNFPSPSSLSPALTPSPNVLPAPTPGAVELGLHKFSFPNHKLSGSRPTRSPLVTSVNHNGVSPGYFDMPVRVSSPVLPENAMDVE